jgi:hypothetical protein|tara:strand:+ start:174 stop:515 length:342 start_codon:yes stop_codon:yes gene_type:complete
MSLERGRLSTVVQVAAGSTTSVITVANNKKVYIKSIIAHGVGINTFPTAQVYYVPNGSSADESNRIFDVTLSAKETVLLEPSYPIVLTETGDKLFVGVGNSAINFIIMGDKEA